MINRIHYKGRKTLRRLICLFTVLVLGVATTPALHLNRRGLSGWPPPPEERYDVFVELAAAAAELDDAALVGQLLVIGLDGRSMSDAVRRRLDELRPAGVILFGRNLSDPEQTAEFNTELQGTAAELGLPGLLIAVDQEGGRVRRLKSGYTPIPAMAELPGAADETGARRIGEVIGRELRAVGFNWNLAPVVDVLTNPDNPGIGDRAFSGDPAVVARYAVALAEGLNAAGAACCAKHFPGKGEAARDAHYDLPLIDVDAEHLDEYEWPPFRSLLADNHPARAAMVSHVVIPTLDPELPASLSPAVYRALRSAIGFDGVAVTDDLEMGAIVNDYAVGGAARMAVIAGADLVLVCHDGGRMIAARDALQEALADGELEREELVRRVVRVWALKLALGLPLPGIIDYDHAREELYLRRGLDPAPLVEPPPLSVCGSAEHRRIVREALGGG